MMTTCLNRRSLLQGALASSALLGMGASKAPEETGDTAGLQAALDAGRSLPPGRHRIDRPLIARGPVRGAGAEATELVAAPGLEGPLIAGEGPFFVSNLRARLGARSVHLGTKGVWLRRLG